MANHMMTLRRWQDCQGVLLDLDGVITPTLDLHIEAWQRLFTPYLERRAVEEGRPIAPYSLVDYYTYIDGRERGEGIVELLRSRRLPEAEDSAVVEHLGNCKNDEFVTMLDNEGVRPYAATVALIELAGLLDIPYAVVSASRNTRPVLKAAKLLHKFDVIVDGWTAAEQGLAGKPAPDMYQFAADQLQIPLSECAIFEDAVPGVQAGKAGGCALMVGVDRGSGRGKLMEAGADIVVRDVSEVM